MNPPMAAPGARGRRVGLAGASWSGGGLPTRGRGADLLLPAALVPVWVPTRGPGHVVRADVR